MIIYIDYIYRYMYVYFYVDTCMCIFIYIIWIYIYLYHISHENMMVSNELVLPDLANSLSLKYTVGKF